MNYSKIKHWDIANGPGLRISLFVSGCRFHCKGCFNKETWNYNYGIPYSSDTESEIIALVSNEHISGLSLLGGDPLWQDDDGIASLIQMVKRVSGLNKSIWLWSGFTFEYIMEHGTKLQKQLIQEVDVWVDGQFIEDQKDLRLKFRGSKNQRVIDVQKSLKKGTVELYEIGE